MGGTVRVALGNDRSRVAAAGGEGEPVKLTDARMDHSGYHFPAWSPEGARIALVGTEGWVDNIFLMDPDGSERTNLTDLPPTSGHTPTYHHDPAWFPGGKRLVYAKAEQANACDADLYRLNVETGGEVRLTFGGGQDYSPAVSPDGKRIAFMGGRDGDWEIYVMRAAAVGEDNRPLRLTNNDDWLVNGFYVAVQHVYPTWSPDGRQIAFSSDRDGDEEIYRMMAAPAGPANRPVRLTDNAVDDVQPAWSPGGGRIAYRGDGDLWTMDGGCVRRFH